MIIYILTDFLCSMDATKAVNLWSMTRSSKLQWRLYTTFKSLHEVLRLYDVTNKIVSLDSRPPDRIPMGYILFEIC
jgi:hypothetical protein